jgi:hypothetical protein
VVLLPEGVELNYISREETGIYYWGVYISHIVCKGDELVGEVEKWSLSYSIYPKL